MTAISILCEGAGKSPDIRLLNQILLGLNISIIPSGSKYGLGEKIKTRRNILKTPVFGITDRDFDGENVHPTNIPIKWEGKENDEIIHFGWRWERKEIENYLIDPEVIGHIFSDRLNLDEYKSTLDQAVQGIAIYTAARMALSINRTRFSPLPNSWGKPKGKDDHHFPDTLPMTKTDCETEIGAILSQYIQQQPQLDNILDSLDDLIKQCSPGGTRFSHYLHYFSGKDLLLYIDKKIRSWGFQSAMGFRSAILSRLESTPQNVWDWLPEWQAMRDNIATYA